MNLIIIFAGAFCLIVIAFLLILRNVIHSRISKIYAKYQLQDAIIIVKNANFFGQKSLGYIQIRGNGVLALTSDKLFFEMWLPKKGIEIPINRITYINNPIQFLGKTKLRSLLKVTFINQNGQTDSAAWQISELDRWTNELHKLLMK